MLDPSQPGPRAFAAGSPYPQCPYVPVLGIPVGSEHTSAKNLYRSSCEWEESSRHRNVYFCRKCLWEIRILRPMDP